MILGCNKSCKKRDGTTTGSLDIETDNVMCDNCGDTLSDITSYTKKVLKNLGKIIRTKNKKAFVMKCLACSESVEVKTVNGKLQGKVCSTGKCNIQSTKFFENAVNVINEFNDKNDIDSGEQNDTRGSVKR